VCVVAPSDDFQLAAGGVEDGDLALPGIATISPDIMERLVFVMGRLDDVERAIAGLCVGRLYAKGHRQARHIRDHVSLAPLGPPPCIVA